MITIKTLEFDNCFSYGQNNKIDFTKNSVNLLDAPNGSGKSSLMYILQEGLASKNIKKLKKEVISNRNTDFDGYNIKVNFTKDEDDYIVQVNRKGKTSKVKLFKNNIDISEHKIPDTYKLIDNLFGDIDLSFQLMYQSSKDSLEFLKATDTNRKRFLIKLCDLQKYLDIGDTIKLKISGIEKELLKCEGELKSVTDFIEETKIPEKLDKKEIPVFEDLSEKIIELSATIANYKEKDKAISRNNVYKTERDNIVFDMNMKFTEEDILQDLKLDLEDVKDAISKTTNNISNITSQISKLDTTDVCYACGQSIDVSNNLSIKEDLQKKLVEVKQSKEILANNKENIVKKITKLTKDKNDCITNQDNIKRFEELSNIIDNSLPETQENYLDLESNLAKLKTKQKENVESIKTVEDYNNKVDNRNTQIDTLKQQKQNFYARQELLKNDIVKLQTSISNLNICKKAFSPSGIVAYKLENYTKNFEDSINNYLNELSDGQFQLLFRLDNEKLNIVIIDNGQECTIDSLSTGEFSRVQFSVLLAIRKIISQINKESINLLFLDEITGVLDSAGKNKLIDVLLEEKNTNVFIVSHDFDHPLMTKINIMKENNISCIDQ